MKNRVPALVSLLMVVVFLLVSAGLAIFLGQRPLGWQVSLGLAGLTFIAYIVLDLEFLKELFSKRTTLYGLNSLVMAVIVLVIFIMVNVIAKEYDLKADLTKNRLHSLSEQSIKLLKNLDQDISIKIIDQPQSLPIWRKVIDRYTYYSKRVTQSDYDPDRDFHLIQKYQITKSTRLPILVVESETRSAKVDNLYQGDTDPKLEEKLTNAIIKVAKGEKKKIYFTKGHGERQLEDTRGFGLSKLKTDLQEGRYDVAELVTVNTKDVPEDADILVLAGPTSSFMDFEFELIDRYLRRGGKVLLMMELNSDASMKPFLQKYGIDWKANTTVVELNPNLLQRGGDPLMPLVFKYDSAHPITKDFNQLTIFSRATPIAKAKAPPREFKLTSLFSSSPDSLIGNVKGDRLGKLDQKTKGTHSLAVTVSGQFEDVVKAKKQATKNKKDKEAKTETTSEPSDEAAEFRLVVVGDSDFVTNNMISAASNRDLYSNVFSWLAEEEDLISIRPRPADESKLVLSYAQSLFIMIISVFVMPVAMLISGIAVFVARRRK